MSLLDRYAFRKFLARFFMCSAGITAIWFLVDVSDNFNDCLEAHASFEQIFSHYLTQAPHTILLSVLVGLALALLWSPRRKSQANL